MKNTKGTQKETIESIKQKIASDIGYNSFNQLLEIESTENISIAVNYCMREFANIRMDDLHKELTLLYTYDIREKSKNKINKYSLQSLWRKIKVHLK